MTEQDRGAYTPQTDAPLAFDARYSRGSGDRPIPWTLVISGVVLITLVGALAFFYRDGFRRAGETPAVVGAPVADTKAAPSGQANSADPAAGLQVYKAEATPAHEGGPAVSATLAPGPETPSVRPVTAAPIDDAKLRPAQGDAAARVVPPPPPTVVAAAKTSTATPVAAPPKTEALKTEAPKTVKTVVATSGNAAAKPVKAATAEAAKPVKVAKAAVQPKPVDAEIPTGAPVAQIGAFSSEALAMKGWSDVAVLMPGQMAGKTRKVEMANVNGKTFYRGFVGGFASKSAAESFCASLQAAGKGCIVR
jgi:hypothetical protein